jgi:hypothetical protein
VAGPGPHTDPRCDTAAGRRQCDNRSVVGVDLSDTDQVTRSDAMGPAAPMGADAGGGESAESPILALARALMCTLKTAALTEPPGVPATQCH